MDPPDRIQPTHAHNAARHGVRPPAERSETPDAALLRDLARGDTDALGALYDAHAPALLGLATRILGANEADDLVHDLFMEVWQRVSSYDPSRGSARTWLLVRLRSRAIDRLRSRAARLALLADARSDPSATHPPDDTAIDPSRESDRHRVLDELERLTERQREVLALAYFEGLSFREIGVRCGVPVGTVKSRLSGAVAALRRTLASTLEDEHR